MIKNIYKYNPKVKYEANSGKYLQIIKKEELCKQNIIVNAKTNESFSIEFPDVFVMYLLGPMKTTDKKWTNWNNHPFKLWQTQINFAVWCASSACGVSSEHLNEKGHSMIKSFYRFHVYYHIRRVFKLLQLALPYEDSFNQFDNSYNREGFLKVCADYDVSDIQKKYRGEYFFSSLQENKMTVFDESSMTRWIIDKSKGFTRSGVEMISMSVRAYSYLILTSQASVKASIIGNKVTAITAQKAFLDNFEDIINRKKDIQTDIQEYQNTINEASTALDYSVGENIYMLPSNMNLKIDKVENYNNKITISPKGSKLGLNKINQKSIAVIDSNTLKYRKVDKNVSHEEEKVALILFLTLGCSIWYMFR